MLAASAGISRFVSDSAEVYFHRNAVVGESFDKLAVGDESVSPFTWAKVRTGLRRAW